MVRIHLDNPWSGGEKELQDLLRRHGVRGWVANHALEIGGTTYYPDLYIADVPLVIEYDGYRVHSRPDVFETDRIRQNALVRAGVTVLRYTWKRLQEDPDAVVAEIRAAIAGEMARDPERPSADRLTRRRHRAPSHGRTDRTTRKRHTAAHPDRPNGRRPSRTPIAPPPS